MTSRTWDEPTIRPTFTFWMHVLCASLSGLLLGYDLCIISSILSPVQRSLELCVHDPCFDGADSTSLAKCSCPEKQFAVSAVAIGAIIGGLAGGLLTDACGRRLVIALSDMIFIVGGLAMALSEPGTITLFFAGRVLVGIALGASFGVSSAYIAEIAPLNMRGALITANEVSVCGGCLASYIVTFALGDAWWRYSLCCSVLVALLQICGVACMHESPRWSLSHNHIEHASCALKSLGFPPIKSSAKTPVSERLEYSVLRTLPRLIAYWRVLLLALGCAAAHSATAANTVLYYSRDILLLAGVTQPILANVAMGVVKLTGVLVCLMLVDRFGRRKLLLFGTAGIVLSLTGLAVGFMHKETPEPVVTLTSLLTFILFWDVSWAGLMLTVVAEILPQEVRGFGVGATYSLYWMLTFAQSQTLETLFRLLGVAETFALYAATSTLAMAFTYKYIIETGSQSLEAIQIQQSEMLPIANAKSCSSSSQL
eukprot:CAMPEP_0119308094 /NCGR_PEP_ID=MMETSP1333-20130426/8402_1 /TAXON_ID=418940 /ORGANISM="Scyphosphaera apsteinii, Strain RCC1455" /LENGTH=482 /DNA_ID=CAMNT_0007311789 /DNA_START=135 /DNA_END=1583 /DNA_ORIENTATION=+